MTLEEFILNEENKLNENLKVDIESAIKDFEKTYKNKDYAEDYYPEYEAYTIYSGDNGNDIKVKKEYDKIFKKLHVTPRNYKKINFNKNNSEFSLFIDLNGLSGKSYFYKDLIGTYPASHNDGDDKGERRVYKYEYDNGKSIIIDKLYIDEDGDKVDDDFYIIIKDKEIDDFKNWMKKS